MAFGGSSQGPKRQDKRKTQGAYAPSFFLTLLLLLLLLLHFVTFCLLLVSLLFFIFFFLSCWSGLQLLWSCFHLYMHVVVLFLFFCCVLFNMLLVLLCPFISCSYFFFLSSSTSSPLSVSASSWGSVSFSFNYYFLCFFVLLALVPLLPLLDPILISIILNNFGVFFGTIIIEMGEKTRGRLI